MYFKEGMNNMHLMSLRKYFLRGVLFFLLGQSALEKFGKVSIDYNELEITFE